MTQAQLDHAVASATGEMIRDVQAHGFSLLGDGPESLDPDDLSLLLDFAPHAIHAAGMTVCRT